ncbi:MAG: Gfo/Idh/MocA family oxidoreductase [Planctomycetes bacterium]|nr:Gfo/Idh/MocA family oxidoreductase [Planctomycetota bacterium]MBT6967395.1 Gfo/Idh/MocA family oxidoreductase [Planctomycetota bacterium]MBT7104041.1 Gfo/Idh/MocA family oxidoreductase [Planctomycetota bacterium]MBT7640621.1 Gfo/Idh/MocA family oxidoreductase [Planctomycetota bacterium]
MSQRVRIGMIGGGQGAFIGGVHRIALRMDDAFELVAGCFGRDPNNTKATGAELGLDPDRCYPTWERMIEAESQLPPEQRIEAVSIVTPNHVHHGPAKAALEAGFHVICDKPLCISQEQADDLAATVEKTGRVFALTHNYCASPMVREARERIARGDLGTIRKVYVEYLQGWLSEKLEDSGQKQADWRTDPARSGPVGALGDIGTHAHQLLEFVSGDRVTSIYAILQTFVEDRALDDDDMILLKMASGATGTLCCSQVCFGKENGLKLRIFGTEGAIEWDQEQPNDLKVIGSDGAATTIRTATGAAGEASTSLTRTPAGHPEGYLEAFANIYIAFARAIRQQEQPLANPFPTVDDGVRGIRFVGAALLSSAENRWVDIPE